MATGSASPEARAPRLPSLRDRLALAFAVLVIGVAVGQALAVHLTTERAEEALIDRIVEEQLGRSIAMYRTQPEFAFPNTGDMSLYVVEDGAPSDLPEWLRAVPARDGRHELYPAPDVEMHVAVRRDGARVFYLAYDVAEHEQRRRDGLAILAMTLIGAGVLGLVLARALAGRLLGDLERLSHAVRQSPDEAATPLASLAAHRETHALARALDEARERSGAALARERAFAAAANHELRTPLMQASSTLELLAARPVDDAQRMALARLGDAHAELRALAEALLRVARGRTAEARSTVALASLAATLLERVEPDARARGIALASRVPEGAVARSDRGSLEIVLLNLLRNAIRHSGGRQVTIELAEDGLRVEDDGLGFEPLPGAGKRASLRTPRLDPDDDDPLRGQADLGIGLPIVERVCEANGWTLAIASRLGGGTRVTLGLPGSAGVMESSSP